MYSIDYKQLEQKNIMINIKKMNYMFGKSLIIYLTKIDNYQSFIHIKPIILFFSMFKPRILPTWRIPCFCPWRSDSMRRCGT